MYDYRFETPRIVFVIDTKSFYASVEAVERGLHPMKVPLVVVSTGPNVGGGGLVLATSPTAKKRYGLKNNVSRMKDLQGLPGLIQVPPRMNLYIQKNMEINAIYRQYVADADWHPYSIDESILDLTDTWQFFGHTPWEVARKIQREVHEKTGLYTTVGIGDNPALAKIALDRYAKHDPSFIGEIHFNTVPDKLWPVQPLDTIWSIGHRTAKKLNQMGIYSMADLAHCNPFRLRKVFGPQNGLRLYALAWGVDRTRIRDKVMPESRTIGNSQVLPRRYTRLSDITVVLREIVAQVATRLRFQQLLAGSISIHVGNDGVENSLHQTVRLTTPTNITRRLQDEAIALLTKHWHDGGARHLAVYFGELSSDHVAQLDLFHDRTQTEKQQRLDRTIDAIRKKFGFTKLVHGVSLDPAGTAISRANLVGGHNGGHANE
ncbi:MAG: Y-family DNA polymerase [Leuconostoc sp.]|uniref:Y-family DNA polymerase n=1 Tax=Leuconostoc sp. TaxID=1930076 RepID=UPI0039EA965D